MTSIDPGLSAAQELADNLIVAPELALEELSPMGMLAYLQQTSWATFMAWTAYATDLVESDPAAGADLAETLSGVGEVCGRLNAICERIGLIPEGASQFPHD